jgi:hypothetical protein
LNTAFNIPPVDIENKSLHLLVEVGSYGISFLWFTKVSFSVKGLAMYNFTSADILPGITNVFELQKKYLTRLGSVTVCYDFKESVLVPAKYNHIAVNDGALSLMYGEDRDSILSNDLITSLQVYNHYRIPKDVETLFSKQFPSANIFHSTSLQMEQLNHANDLLYCIIFNNTAKVIFYKTGKPQIIQQFGYTSPADLAWFLLNICEQHDSRPSQLHLRLSGMIGEHSKLYNELGQYFSNIEFDRSHGTVYEPPEIKDLPAHYFSHLTALALCVS